MPVPPPTNAIGDVPEPLQARQRPSPSAAIADVQARRRRIEADVGGDRRSPPAPRARRRWPRTPCRATRILRKQFIEPEQLTIFFARGPDAPRSSCDRRPSTSVGALDRRSAAYGVAYERHQIDAHRPRPAGARPAAGARRAPRRHDHRRPSQLRRAAPTTSRARWRCCKDAAPDIDRARRRLRVVFRSPLRRPRSPNCWRRWPRARTARSRCSAITTMSARCRRRWRNAASRC